MPNWKKVIVSGSNVSQLNNDGVYLRTIGGGILSSSAQLTTEFDTRYLNTTGDSVISSSAQLTGTFDTRYLNTTGDNVLSSSAQISSVASASFASNGHNFVATGTSEIDALQLGSLTTGIASFISATGSFVPNNSTNFTIFTVNVLTNEALFIDYVIQDTARNNKRAGNLRFTWNATDTVFDETSTTSIGNTNNFTFSTNNNGTNLNVLVNNTTGQGMSIIFEYKILYIQ